jgi:mono/diheme cytochrome c family protein
MDNYVIINQLSMIKKLSPRFLSFLITAIVCSVTIPGCYNDKADLIIPNNNCDTAKAISYRTDVVNILQQNCYICHGSDKFSTLGGDHELQSFSVLQEMVANGKLLKAINHEPGAVPMPYGGGKLSDCEIMTITAWVNRGAPNN